MLQFPEPSQLKKMFGSKTAKLVRGNERMKNLLYLVCFFSLIIVSASATKAQDAVVETVLDGLNNPSGVAIQPETGHVFVADSGNLRVIRVVDGKAENVITDFPRDVYGKGPFYDIGPLGLLFLDKDTLMVGGGGLPDGEEMLRVFKLPGVGEKPIKADQLHGEAKVLSPTDLAPGEGNFYAMVKGSKGVYVTCNGDDRKGWVALATLDEDLKLQDFKRSIATKRAIGVDAPVAITISPERFLVVGQMGEINVAGDSQLTFYSEETKSHENFKLELHDITALAYSPIRKRLFCTDFNWGDTDNGGLYKIVRARNKNGCIAKQIVPLKKPTALAFNSDGDLYITLAGTTSEGTKEPDGQLVMIRRLDVAPRKVE